MDFKAKFTIKASIFNKRNLCCKESQNITLQKQEMKSKFHSYSFKAPFSPLKSIPIPSDATQPWSDPTTQSCAGIPLDLRAKQVLNSLNSIFLIRQVELSFSAISTNTSNHNSLKIILKLQLGTFKQKMTIFPNYKIN